MTEYFVSFDKAQEPVRVKRGTLLSEAARLAGIDVNQPCGGQGRCGRCTLQVLSGDVHRRSSVRLTQEDIDLGYVLACQTSVESDLVVHVPPQEKIERRLTTDRTAIRVSAPEGYHYPGAQYVQRIRVILEPPSMDDQTDDWNRLQKAVRKEAGLKEIAASVSVLRTLGPILREGEWKATVVLDTQPGGASGTVPRMVAIYPGHIPDEAPLWGAAVDIGTTTVTVWLVDLIRGRVAAQASEYNGQIARGEDVISRIIFASKSNGAGEMQQRVVETINSLISRACRECGIDPSAVVKAVIAGNSTMIHLFLGIPASSIRLAPFITAVNQAPLINAKEIGINILEEATIDCLPGVASYVGSDITSGVLASGVDKTEKLTLFLDVGTNGEIVLGCQDWLVTCACSAGPAFEGAGVLHGMRATQGAIEEVWINTGSFEPNYRVIGDVKPRGICGSGLISLIAEMFISGVVDKSGRINGGLDSPRIRSTDRGPEYVVAWGSETEHGTDIVINHTDIDNLLRAKAAIFAGFSVLADRVGIPLEAVEQVLIGGSFGKYINVEKAVQIGLLPDMPWERFNFLGNTSVLGAYKSLLFKEARERIKEIAARMTYIELSADNSFYEAFMSALFLPHTDLGRFPTVAALINIEPAV